MSENGMFCLGLMCMLQTRRRRRWRMWPGQVDKCRESSLSHDIHSADNAGENWQANQS